MATKKNAEPEAMTAETEIQAEVEAAETEIQAEVMAEGAAETGAKRSAWDETVKMHVPRRPRGDDQFYYICVNDRRFQVPADGKVQELPVPIAAILQMSLDAEADAERFIDGLPNQATAPQPKI